MISQSLLDPTEAVAALATPERFLLWAMRVWVQACKTRSLPARGVEEAFAAMGLDEAAKALDAALRGVALTTRRALLVHCPHCPALSEDERLLLDAAATLQSGDHDRAERLLCDIVPPRAAAAILIPLGGLGRLLALAGIDLPCRSEARLSGKDGFDAGTSRLTLH